jgi:uncharacterized protein YcaQ
MTPARPVTLAQLRAFAITHSLFKPTTLPKALAKLGFVQADPIRAPARAQDLILRHRVANYRDGDLERRYPRLAIEEDALHNYGFLSRELQSLLHPRGLHRPSRIERSHPELLEPVLEFVRANGPTHPRDLDPQHGGRSVTNYWGGSSSAATHVLDILHYRGALRVVRRDSGVRVYAVATHHRPAGEAGPGEDERVGRLVARMVDLYAPVHGSTLRQLTMMLRYGAPHLEPRLRERNVLRRALDTGSIAAIGVDGSQWFVPAGARFRGEAPPVVRFLAPFDPVVWDRRRFEIFWGWRYRFEAYTPASKRQLGYYALPLLWGERIVGWATVRNGGDDRLVVELGYVERRPRESAFKRELGAELERMRVFLGVARMGKVVGG